MTGILDRLPAPMRHGVLVFFGAFATTILGVVSANTSNLGGIAWPTVLLDALSAGAASAIAAVGLAAATPLTTQYGVGASSAPTDSASNGDLGTVA
jgi:hypothetical protein